MGKRAGALLLRSGGAAMYSISNNVLPEQGSVRERAAARQRGGANKP